MARQNQILINYHTSGLTNMPSAEEGRLGEIVVRHNDEKPELLVKKNNGEFATFADTKAVETAVASATTALQDVIDDVDAKVDANAKSITALTDNIGKTYVTSADTVAAINAAKSAVTTDAKAYTDSAKTEAIAAASAYTDAQIVVAKGEIQGEIDALGAQIQAANSGTSVLETYVNNTFATSADTVAAIEAAKTGVTADAKAYTDSAKTEAIAAASAYTDSMVASATTVLQDAIDDVDAKADANAKSITALTDNIGKTYATSANTVAAIEAAKTGATADANAYTDSAKTEAIAAASAYTDSKVTSATTALQDEIDRVEGKVDEGLEAVRDELSATTEDLTDLINNKVATAYRFQGSCTYAQLADKEKVNGYVWNVTDANGNYPAGTNYAWSEADQKWDALGGSIDLSPYYKTADFNVFEEEINDKFDTIEANIKAANSGTTELETYVNNTFATSADTVAAINAAKTGATADAKAYTDSAKTEAIAAASAYTDSKVASATTALQDIIDDVDAKVDANAKSITALTDNIGKTYVTSADTVAAIEAAKTGATADANAYTDSAKTAAIAAASAYTDSKVASATTALQDVIDDVDAKVADNAKDIATVSAATFTAIQSASGNCGVTVTRSADDNTMLVFNYSEMIIDGGEF